MITYLKRLFDERQSLTAQISGMAERAAGEDRDLTEPEQVSLRGLQQRCDEIDVQIEERRANAESERAWAGLRQSIMDLDGQDDTPGGALVPVGRPTLPAQRSGEPEPLGWGQAVVESTAFRSYDGHGAMPRVTVPGVFETRAPIDTTYLDVPPFQFTPTPWRMTTPLLDSLGRQRVSTNAVEWITFPGSFPLAAVVPEGSLKPEATFVPTEHTASLNTYAHYKAITRQALEDLPRIRQIIETALRGGIFAKMETDAATLLTSSTDLLEVDNADLLAGIRVGIGEVQAAGYATPNAILLNPADFASLDMAIMAATVSGAQRQSSFWGVRAVAAGAIPEGTAYVGDLSAAVTLFDRGQTSVFLTDSHADYFLRNTLVILAETRALPVITEPQAVVRVTVTTTP